jgi:hypothetical protein
MSKKKEIIKITDDMHRQMAVDAFNYTWTLMEKENKTQEEIDEMIHTAHASRFHWGKIGTPTHFERGEWQISRMYTTIDGHAEAAIYHAKRCLEICLTEGIGDWDLAFAYEAIARAYMVASNKDEMKKYLKKAKEAAENIAKKEDKDYLLSELETIK